MVLCQIVCKTLLWLMRWYSCTNLYWWGWNPSFWLLVTVKVTRKHGLWSVLSDWYIPIHHFASGFQWLWQCPRSKWRWWEKAIVDCTHIQLAVSSKESVTFRILHSCHLQCIEQPSPSNHCHRLSTSLTHHCLQQIWSQILLAEWHWGNVNTLCRCPLMRIEEALQHLVLNIHNEDPVCYKLNNNHGSNDEASWESLGWDWVS